MHGPWGGGRLACLRGGRRMSKIKSYKKGTRGHIMQGLRAFPQIYVLRVRCQSFGGFKVEKAYQHTFLKITLASLLRKRLKVAKMETGRLVRSLQ